MPEEIEARFDKQLAYLEQDLRYYRKRSNFFDLLHTATMIVVLLSSFAATVSFFGALMDSDHQKILIVALGFLNVLVTTFDAVIGFSKHARKHDDSYKEATRLHIKMRELEFSDISKQDYIGFVAQYGELTLSNPPIYKALRAICINEVIDVNRYDPAGKIVVSNYQRFLADLVKFSSWSPKLVGAIDATV